MIICCLINRYTLISNRLKINYFRYDNEWWSMIMNKNYDIMIFIKIWLMTNEWY